MAARESSFTFVDASDKDERRRRGIHLTINGIAAGLRNSGWHRASAMRYRPKSSGLVKGAR